MIEYWKTKTVIAIIVTALLGYAAVYIMENTPTPTYDCSLAEFQPDYPIKVKEACRAQRNKK